eukprot:Gregarina_sp_Poly_1__7643@NODE_429_length_8553_cov_130_002239_g350_i0_p4_GENE_NODE_429_length_8553_cov_130_002239_g350_i0NODE_429_length_8553_cov_130_002239_g350_i0_p4_ORF_typecomplete_len298_score39_76BPL_LplA_LipB/PF03099_19/4_8e09BPL_LplA_LipB_2/PF16917_5/2e05BPL_LplA_LipB_2/PF16917_5/4e03_NODE_429_length_8553_cov_130_002239_g350_i066747567
MHCHFPSLPSTHKYAVENVEKFWDSGKFEHDGCVTLCCEKCAGECVLVTADDQFQGVGRVHAGRPTQWLSSPGNVHASALLLLKSKFFSKLSALPIFASAVVLESLVALFPDFSEHLQFKFPNDIMFKGKKMGGILCQLPATADGRYKVRTKGNKDAYWSLLTLLESFQDHVDFEYYAIVSFGLNLLKFPAENMGDVVSRGTLGFDPEGPHHRDAENIAQTVVHQILEFSGNFAHYNELVQSRIWDQEEGTIPVSREPGTPVAQMYVRALDIQHVDLQHAALITSQGTRVYLAEATQ